MAPPDDAQRRIGSIVAEKYRLTRLLGAGGMGAVYEAEHLFTQRRVALKLMHAAISHSGAAAERFLRESRAPSAIGHPGIVQVLDGGVEGDGSPYVVLELLDGVSLSDAIDRGMLDAEAVTEIGIELLDALAAAHDAGFVHRDIKPENVFLARDVRGATSVRLLDFGIAGIAASDDNPKLTQTGAVLGTPLFMSPEQATGKRADHRSDLWSVGALLYNALAGHPPYSGDSYNALIVSIVTTDPIPLRNLKPDLPEDLLSVVDRALRKDLADRFQSAADMRDELAAVVWPGDEAGGARRHTLPPMPKSERPPATRPEPFAVVSATRGTPTSISPAVAQSWVRSTDGGATPSSGAWWIVIAAALLVGLGAGLVLMRARTRAPAQPSPSVAVATQLAAPSEPPAAPQPAPPSAAAKPDDSHGLQPVKAQNDQPAAQAAKTNLQLGVADAGRPTEQATKAPALAERDPACLAPVLDQHQPQFQKCLEDAVMTQMQQGAVKGESYRLWITLDVAAVGGVEHADVTGQAPADLSACVRKSALDFKFPAAAHSSQLRFPLVLQPTIVGR